MAKIGQFTSGVSTVTPSQGVGVSATPEAFGADVSRGLAQASGAITQAVNTASEISNQIAQKQAAVRTREDTINRARASEQFNQDSFEKFTAFGTEADQLDPQSARIFRQQLTSDAETMLNEHTGSPESKASLEAQLSATVGQYSRQAIQSSTTAQNAFVLNSANGRLSEITARLSDDPSDISNAFIQVQGIVDELGPAMRDVDEVAFIASAQQELVKSSVQAFTDRGNYEAAQELLNENPAFMNALSPESQRSLVFSINAGLEAQREQAQSNQNKAIEMRDLANDLNIDVSDAQIFAAVTGISEEQTPSQSVDAFSEMTGIPVEDMSPETIAKIAFGVDLPKENQIDPIDQTKERTPSGDLTRKGIGIKVKKPWDRASNVKVLQDKVDSQLALFEQTGNPQTILAAMITYQKALDEGAIVREGDIILQRSAQSLTDRMGGFIDRQAKGQPISNEAIQDMADSMKAFTNASLSNEKALIDPFIAEGDRLGYSRLDTIPRSSYDTVFDGITSRTQGALPPQKITIGLDGKTIEQSEVASAGAEAVSAAQEPENDFDIIIVPNDTKAGKFAGKTIRRFKDGRPPEIIDGE